VNAEPVLIADYDPKWVELYEVLRVRIAGALGSVAATIEHVGSTAIPSLAAKPIIDIDVLLAAESSLGEAISRLEEMGYVYQGNLGIAERDAFRAPAGDIPHHLYICPPHSSEFRKHLAFRDYLRAHPEEAAAYGNLKRALALQFKDDRSAYTAGKGEFVAEILSRM